MPPIFLCVDSIVLQFVLIKQISNLLALVMDFFENSFASD